MMAEAMEFPKTFDEFVNSYGLVDTEEVYTNGSQLIPVFRVKQWLEHISAKTQMIDKSNFDAEQYKTDLQSAYDCGYNKALSENKRDLISRQAVLNQIFYSTDNSGDVVLGSALRHRIENLPSAENKREFDGMTNGEVIQNIYGVMVLTVKDGKVWVEKMYFPFDEVWWNAPYKKEVSE